MIDCIDVSVIVVNYNSAALLINAVNSIFEHTEDVSYEVIVVDNASPDGSGSIVSNFFGNRIKFIQSEENIGFGRANNLAIARAKGNSVFLLNPDTLILNNALWYFVDFAKKNSDKYKIGALGSILFDENMNKTISYSTFPTTKNVLINCLTSFFLFYSNRNRISQFEYSNSDNPFTVDFISGADLFISMNVLNSVGNFDPCFFMYCEETDLQKRIDNAGLQRIIISGPEIIHFDGGTFDEKVRRSNRRRIMKDLGVLTYLKKHNGRLNYLVFRFFFFILRLPAVFNSHYTWKENYEFFKYVLI